MLKDLKIENVAVIEKAQAQFTAGLNVLTGETGAGKSILIDSINAILGNRASRDLVRTGAAKACIWATFTGLPAATNLAGPLIFWGPPAVRWKAPRRWTKA